MESKNEETNDPEYQRAFTALDELSLAFLKPFFKENDLQDDTFSFMKSEVELRNLLRKELELTFGQAFKFSRLWFNKYHESAETFDSGIQPAPKREEKPSHLHSGKVTTITEVHEKTLPFTNPNEYVSPTQPPNSIQITDESDGFRDSTTLKSQQKGKKDETVKSTKEQESSSLSGSQLKEGIPEEKESCQPELQVSSQEKAVLDTEDRDNEHANASLLKESSHSRVDVHEVATNIQDNLPTDEISFKKGIKSPIKVVGNPEDAHNELPSPSIAAETTTATTANKGYCAVRAVHMNTSQSGSSDECDQASSLTTSGWGEEGTDENVTPFVTEKKCVRDGQVEHETHRIEQSDDDACRDARTYQKDVTDDKAQDSEGDPIGKNQKGSAGNKSPTSDVNKQEDVPDECEDGTSRTTTDENYLDTSTETREASGLSSTDSDRPCSKENAKKIENKDDKTTRDVLRGSLISDINNNTMKIDVREMAVFASTEELAAKEERSGGEKAQNGTEDSSEKGEESYGTSLDEQIPVETSKQRSGPEMKSYLPETGQKEISGVVSKCYCENQSISHTTPNEYQEQITKAIVAKKEVVDVEDKGHETSRTEPNLLCGEKEMFPNSFFELMGPDKSESHHSDAQKEGNKTRNKSKVEIVEITQKTTEKYGKKDHTSSKDKTTTKDLQVKKDSKNRPNVQVPQQDESRSNVASSGAVVVPKQEKHEKKKIDEKEATLHRETKDLLKEETVICFPGKTDDDVDEEKVAEELSPQDENQDPAGKQPEKMNELIQAETLERSSSLKDGLVHEEIQSELKLKIASTEEVSSFNDDESKKGSDPSGNDDRNVTKFTTSSDVEDRAISIEETEATSVENKNTEVTFLSADNDHSNQEEKARVENENNQISQKDKYVDYRREREDESMVLNQQSSPESNSKKKKKKKKASKGTENIAQTTYLRQDEEKEGPTSSEGQALVPGGYPVTADDLKLTEDNIAEAVTHPEKSLTDEKGKKSCDDSANDRVLDNTVNSGWTLNADPLLVANNDENEAETAADEYEMDNEISQKEKDMDDRLGYYERKVLKQQSSSDSKSKNKKTKEASKQTENSAQTINRGDEKMTEGPSSSEGKKLVAIDHLAAAVEITPVGDNVGATVTFPGKRGNTVFPTDTSETTTNKKNETYLGGSSQKVAPSKTNTFRSTLHVNEQTTKQDQDGAKTLNQESESKVKHLTESRTGDEGKDSAHVSRCSPRPRGVPGRSISYEKGSVLDAEENRELEFKSLVSAQPSSLPWKIMEKAKKFICACLNADRQGIIYFGVGDSQEKGSNYQHGEIIGLDVEDIRDDINKAFQFVLDDHIKSDAGALQKAGEQNCVNIYFVPVKNQGNRCHRYVIEIEVARDWRFCKDNIYYSKSWTEKRGADKDCTGKKALSDFFKVKDEFDDVAIRTNGASSCVKPHEVERQAKKPLEVKYKDWRRKTKHGANELPEEFSSEDADAKRLSVVLRKRLRELNYKEYSYLLVANKIPAQYRGTAHLSFLQNIPWVAVFDLFDPSSKRDGLHHACNETTDAPRAKIRTLDDFKEETPDISTRGTTWILNNEEMQKGDWIKCSKDCLYRALSAYKQCFPPGQLVCVFLCFSENAVNEMADIMESSFSILGNSASSCVTIISESKAVEEAFIKASKFTLQRELRECSITGIPWSFLKEIVREMVGPSKFEEKGATTELPHFTGFKEVLNKIVYSWDDLEVYYPNPRLPSLAEAIEKDRDAFYKGAQASQINLFQNHSIPRSLEKEVTVKVQRALKSLSKENVDANVHVKTVTVSYEPGSGATTLCRRILWSKRMDYRCAVVKAITPSTDYQIEKLQSIGHDEKNMTYSLPVLVLVDNFPESDVRVLTEHIMKRQTKCVVLTTLPISKSTTNTKFEITLGKLNDEETTLVKDILINITSVDTEKRREAEHVLEREKRFIWFGLELFGREYLKIEERLQNHIHSILMAFLGDSQREHQMLLDICCFLSKYSDGNVILPHSVLLDFFYEKPSWTKQQSPDVQDVHEVFGGLLLEVQDETNGYYGWRPAHSLVSEVVTSRITVEDNAILILEKVIKGKAYVIKFLRHQVFRLFLDRKRISDPVFLEEQAMDDGAVGPDLENEVFGFNGKRTRYSPVIIDILGKESNIQGALNVLLTMCEQAKTEHKAYVWQQLARFMGYEMRANRLDTQDDLYKRLYDAITKEKTVQLPVTTMTGIDAAHMAVDIAVTHQPSYTHHYTTKGVLYLSQLRDYKPPSLRSLPEAIEICRKAMGTYDKALETSRGPNQFSMIGKIQAIISLLEIIKDLPCFHSEDRTFMRYLKEGDPPPEMTEVLSQDDQDYVQSLSSTTRDVLNELFGSVKLKQTTTYDENELRSLHNAKIRACNLRRKFYEITGLDKRELNSEEYSMRLSSSTCQELALLQQRVQDILFINDETPYSAWSNLADRDVGVIYKLLESLCLHGRGSHNDMLICSKACLQLKEKPPVDDLENIVNIFVRKFPNSQWAHLFYYMIHFPIPNGSLARYTPNIKESVRKCSIIVQEKAGSGFRKSGAEYFLGKGIGLDAIVSSQEFRWLETTWKTKTDFWRGKEPSERLERIQGQKDASRKGIISYHGIQIHFDNTRYPNESKDDLWFYLGFTVAGPYAYDPVDNDTYELLKRSTSLPTTCYASSESPTTSGKSSSFPSNGFGSRRRIRNPPPKIPAVVASVSERNVDENISDDPDILHSRHARNRNEHNDASDGENEWIVVGGRFNALYACDSGENPQKDCKSGRNINKRALFQDQRVERKAPKAAEKRGDVDGVKLKPDHLKTMLGTRGTRKKYFDLKRESTFGKLHHGAFVLGTKKSQECNKHDSKSKTEETERCNFAHGWRGDTLQFVCEKCTEEGMTFCKEKIKHEEYIWNLGPYYNSRGEIWKDETALR